MHSIQPFISLRPSICIIPLTVCAVLITGCNGSSAPEPDSHGMLPSDVVRNALAAAATGDFEKANSFATEAFIAQEQKSRAAKEYSFQQQSWPVMSQGISDAQADLTFQPTEMHPDGFAGVSVRTPASGDAWVGFTCIKREGKWMIGLYTGRTPDNKAIIE